MSLRDVDFHTEYRSLLSNISSDFLIPALKESVSYKRAVGFFSSTALSKIADGLEGLICNGGKVQLVASPYLSDEDYEAIKRGYESRNKVIENAIYREMQTPKSRPEEDRLNLLANLISDRLLDIKIAFIEDTNKMGMYHEKMGIIEDAFGNAVAFSGSMNESETALEVNYETIDVFCSWKNDSEEDRVNRKKNAFTAIWNNSEPNIVIVDFPKLKDDIIDRYKKSKIDYTSWVTPPLIPVKKEELIKTQFLGSHIPDGVSLHDYQTKAIEVWEEKGYKGIFDMATGTGKTFTGLGAIVRLAEKLNNRLAVVIVCPYQHLVEQWVEDIVKFNISPIVGYSSSPQKDWKNRLQRCIRNQKLGVSGQEFLCFICTNATYSSEFVQTELGKIKGDCLIVVDEAHNFGAKNLRRCLLERFKYRLALSATLDRHNDPEGTQCLYNYFGEKCIEYSLERAIKEKKLTPYRYYPVIVVLTASELDRYRQLSREIKKCISKDKNGAVKISERGKRLALQRARIVAAAEGKIDALRNNIQPYIDKNYILVYCGSATMLDVNRDYSEVDNEDLRQIDAVTDVLGNELGMSVSQFTSREDVEERTILKEQFALGKGLQALIAIKCLDEGVNIPNIRTAFILASTSNPKEYIQRRGRVLRLSKGKDYAEIFDFITLPRSLDDVVSMSEEEKRDEMSLAKNELVRAFEFARLATNYVEANSLLDSIREAYGIEDEDYEFEEDFSYDD